MKKKTRIRSDRYTAIALYFGFLAASLCTVFLFGTMTRQEEFTAASSAAFMLGKDWSSVIDTPWGAGNMLMGVIYLPAMLIFYDPVIRYYMFIVMGALIFSFVPVTVFKLTKRFSVEKTGARAAISVLCGFYSSLLVSSKFMFSESFAAVAIWLLILILFREPKSTESKASKILCTIFAALLSAAAYFSSPACIAVFFSVIIYSLYVAMRRKRSPIYILFYFVLFALIFAADIFLTDIISKSGIYLFSGGFIPSVADSAGLLTENPFGLICAAAGRVYYFVTSTWGIGAVAFAFTVYAAHSNHINRRNGSEIVFAENLVLLGLFCIITAASAALIDSFFSLSDPAGTQNVILGSLPSELVAAPSVLVLFIYLYRYGINYIRLMATIAATAVLEAAAMIITTGALGKTDEIDAVKAAPLNALRPDALPTQAFAGENIYYPIAMLFIVFAVIIPIVCCTDKYRSKLVSIIFSLLLIYSSVVSSVTSVMATTEKSLENAETARQLSSCIASAGGGADFCAAVISDDNDAAMVMQFFNPDADVIRVYDESEIPESCYVISGERLGVKDGSLLLIGRMRGFNVYAKGIAAKPVEPNTGEEQEKPAA